MRKYLSVVLGLLAVEVVAAPTANEDYVDRQDAQTYTNAVNAATFSAYSVVTNNVNSGYLCTVAEADKKYVTITNNTPFPLNGKIGARVGSFKWGSEYARTAYQMESTNDNTIMYLNNDGRVWIMTNGVTYCTLAKKEDTIATNGVSYVGRSFDLRDAKNKHSVMYRGREPVTDYDGWIFEGISRTAASTGIIKNGNGSLTTGYYGDRLCQWGHAESANRVYAYTNEIDYTTNNAVLVSTVTNIAKSVTAYDIGAVPTTRKVNGQPLTNDITIAAGVTSVNSKTGVVSLNAADVGAYGATAGSTLASQVATIGAHLNAEDARFVVTNYNSVTHTPEAYVEIKLPDQSWSLIWSEMTRWNYLFDTYLPTNYYTKGQVDTALYQKADRAWGAYDSETGAYAPDDYTWISSKKIAIAANLVYQRTITTEGAIWVLESNGNVTETGGLTNGFFRISDDEGNALFEIVKGSKLTVGADPSSCQVVGAFTPTKLQIGYSVVSDVHPTLYVCNSLSTQLWKAETDADCLANVVWSGSSGAWVAQVQGKTAQTALFVKATYEVGGETYISNTAPVSMQYLMLNGVKYAVGTATISGNTVLTLTVAP